MSERFISSRQTGDFFLEDEGFLDKEPSQRGGGGDDPWSSLRRLSFRLIIVLGAVASFAALLIRAQMPLNSTLFRDSAALTLVLALAVISVRCRSARTHQRLTSWRAGAIVLQSLLTVTLTLPACLFILNAYFADEPQELQAKIEELEPLQGRGALQRVTLSLPGYERLGALSLKLPEHLEASAQAGESLPVTLQLGGLGYPLLDFPSGSP